MLLAETLITPGQVYCITQLDHFREFLQATLVVAGIITFFVIFSICIGALDSRFSKWFASPALVLLLLALGAAIGLLPTTKDAVLIFGLPAIVNNEKVQQKAANALDGTEDLLRLAKGYVEDKLKAEDGKEHR